MKDIKDIIDGLERCKKHDGNQCRGCPYRNCGCVDDLVADAQRMLEEQQERIAIMTEWQPEIVRCKDCKMQECEGRNGMIVCDITGESHSPDWFCADGERVSE